ncbi:flagellar motor protein MotA [Rhodomicrobium lacus]|jgi:methyl-accepting chemotaxis protein|uniref:flagellar motor protein MotA n=1 Tax=Rhodomicrobium TaxID=1068 RepID=UPI000F8D00FB|nr:flagellar motor protein MotA [Rhodomicrobium lacus]WKW50304.1 flagellar motor protein MotA [Rhodomicrobium lacus]
MSKSPYYKTLSGPGRFVGRMLLFLILAGLIGFIIHKQIIENFDHNRPLNTLIVGVLIFGILYTFQQVFRLFPEVRWVNNFRLSDPVATDRSPAMLAPMATLLQRRQGQGTISPVAMRSILDSIASRLDESRETTRYLVGLLIFLGLLGTFWGLLETTGSVGQTISALNTEGKETAEVFQELKTGLEAPLRGMGTAFSASLFGLAGSLILGFLDLQAGQAQARFYNELEEWLSTITELRSEGPADAPGSQAQLRFALLDMQRSISDLAEKIEHGFIRGGGANSEHLAKLSEGIDKLVQQMRAEQKVLREWVDEQSHNQGELAAVLKEQNRLAGALREIAARARRDPVDR